MGKPIVFSGTDAKLIVSGDLLAKDSVPYPKTGEKNYVAAPSSAIGWSASGAGVTVATDTTVADLPRPNTTKSGIKITGVSGSTAYAYYRFILDDCDASNKLKVRFALKPVTGYVASDFKVDVYSNTASDYTTGNTRIALSTDATSISAIPNTTGMYQTTFTAPAISAKWIEVRIGLNGTNTHSLVVSDFIVGPAVMILGPGVAGGQSLSGGTGASENLTIDSTANATKGSIVLNPSGGSVGIGTGSATPTMSLDIVAPTNNSYDALTLRPLNLSQTLTLGWHGVSCTSNSLILNGSDGTSAIHFQAANSEKMTILTNGNVGIGASSPSALLEVGGQVKITGGTPGTGKILTSDSVGLASWSAAAIAATSITAVSSNVTLTNKSIHLVDTSVARSLTLPAPTATSFIVIKDKTGSCATNNITVVRAATEKIETVAASYVLDTDLGSWTFVSDGTDWFII